jgi:hypothetical protein
MARKSKTENLTNVEFVTHLMERSNHGPLAQLFIIDALEKWSDIIAKADPAQLDTPFISGKAWVSVAREIQDKLATRFSS